MYMCMIICKATSTKGVIGACRLLVLVFTLELAIKRYTTNSRLVDINALSTYGSQIHIMMII